MRARILVVEDEETLLAFYRQVLGAEGYQVRCVRAGEEALRAFRAFGPDLVILDLGLAGKLDGFDVLHALRQENTAARVVILTGQLGDEKVVRGLEGGADDYVIKTVSREHLLARVKAQLRRAPAGAAEVYRYGEMEIDLRSNQARRRDKRMVFGEAERRVLARLLQTPGQAVSFGELSQVGWGFALPQRYYPEDLGVVKSCIYRLRTKLGSEIIASARDLGYLIAEPDTEAPTQPAQPRRARSRPGKRAKTAKAGRA